MCGWWKHVLRFDCQSFKEKLLLNLRSECCCVQGPVWRMNLCLLMRYWCCCQTFLTSCFLQVARMQLPTWLLGTCLWLLCITGVWTATFKLAVIGPWSCDPMFSRAMPTAAANLALSRLRRDSSLSRGYRYDVKLLEEDCSASKGLLPNHLMSQTIN